MKLTVFSVPSLHLTVKILGRNSPVLALLTSSIHFEITLCRYFESGNAFLNHSLPLGTSSRGYPNISMNFGLMY